jgi:hypothetical protein
MDDLVGFLILLVIVGAIWAAALLTLVLAIILGCIYVTARVGYMIGGERGAMVLSFIAILALCAGIIYGAN